MKAESRWLALAVAGFAVVVSTSASGAAERRAGGAGECPKGYLCVWADADFGGQMVQVGKVGLSDKIYHRMNDQASSVKNRREQSSIVFTDTQGGGSSLCLAPGHKYTNLLDQTIDDSLSSSRLKRNSAVC